MQGQIRQTTNLIWNLRWNKNIFLGDIQAKTENYCRKIERNPSESGQRERISCQIGLQREIDQKEGKIRIGLGSGRRSWWGRKLRIRE